MMNAFLKKFWLNALRQLQAIIAPTRRVNNNLICDSKDYTMLGLYEQGNIVRRKQRINAAAGNKDKQA